MTQKNFSFWLCTLLSGIVIGIASQRIPANPNSEAFKPYPYSFYCTDQSLLPNQPIPSLPIQKPGYSLAYDMHYHN